MERPVFGDLVGPGAPPMPRAADAVKQRFVTPAPLPPVTVQARPQPVAIAIVEVAPPAVWGPIERLRFDLPTAPPAPVAVPTERMPWPAVAMGVTALAIALVVGLLARGGDSDLSAAAARFAGKTTAPAAHAEPVRADDSSAEPVAEPVVVPIDETVDASFTAEPAGARLVLVEDGAPIDLGSAPATAHLDRNRAYELMVEHDGYWSDVRILMPENGPVSEHVVLEPKQLASSERPARSAPVVRRARRATATKRTARHKGTLMIHAKPPCEIEIDGRDTGLMTPRRDISLLPGRHKVTLVNRAHGIREQVVVNVVAGRTVRVTKDLTDRL